MATVDSPSIPIVKSMDSKVVDNTVGDYLSYHKLDRGGDPGQSESSSGKTKATYLEECAKMVNQYFDLATDFYEWGWGQSFHFSVRHKKESFEASIARHEYYLAHKLKVEPGYKVLDVGCGVGGPMRNIARFGECSVVGINNNEYQISRANYLNKQAGLDKRCSLVKGNFNTLPFESNSFDGVYQIEATAHAADKRVVYGEIFRVLKPGQYFASYEWCLTDKYDSNNSRHRQIKKGIEEGDGLPGIATTNEVVEALKDVGFEVVFAKDVGEESEIPWYAPLEPGYTSLSNFQFTPVGKNLSLKFLTVLEFLHVAPKGSAGVSSFLQTAASALSEGGRNGIFTPMYFTLARKPE